MPVLYKNSVGYIPKTENAASISIVDNGDELLRITKDKVTVRKYLEVLNGSNIEQAISLDKKIVLEGDSITYGYNPNGSRFLFYQKQLEEKLPGLTVVNTGVSSSTITKMNSLPQISSNSRMNSVISNNPDIILLLAGVNDYGTSAPIGNIGDSGDETFSGAFEILIKTYLSALPNVRLIYCTPTPYNYHFVGFADIHSGRVANSQGKILRDYVDRATEICKLYSIPIVDANHNAGWLDLNETEGSYKYTTDGIHLSEMGYDRLTDLQVAKIKELFNL